jgi:glycosyltransferase involved in cell wall biosynthesis
MSIDSALFSIIMPAYNAEAFIERAIDSVLSQTYPNWELIVINDASSDRTKEKTLSYSDPRIRYFETEGLRKPGIVRNYGFTLTQGDFITLLDADDEYYPDSLSSFHNAFKQNADLQACFGYPDLTNERHEVIKPFSDFLKDNDPKQCFKLEYLCQKPITFDYRLLCFKKELLGQIGNYDESLLIVEDIKYNLSILMLGEEKSILMQHPTYQYRMNTSSLTHEFNPGKIPEFLKNQNDLIDWLFTHPSLPNQLKQNRSRQLAYNYGMRIGILLDHNHGDIARQLINDALHNPKIKINDAFCILYKMMLRAYFPIANNAAKSIKANLSHKQPEVATSH